MCNVACLNNILLLLTLVLPSSCATCDSANAREKRDPAVVTGVVGIASLRATLRGESVLIRISPLEDEMGIKQALRTFQDPRPGTASDMCRADLQRILDNRSLIINYLRCLLPQGSRIYCEHTRSVGPGEIEANVLYFADAQSRGLLVDLACTVLNDGYGMTRSRFCKPSQADGTSNRNDYTVSYFNHARRNRIGLWAIDVEPMRVIWSQPLPQSIEPRLAVPLPSIMVAPKQGGKLEFDSTPTIAITVVGATPRDVRLIARFQQEINSKLRHFVRNCEGEKIFYIGFIEEVERHMVSVLSDFSQGNEKPNVSRVHVRYFTAAAKSATKPPNK